MPPKIIVPPRAWPKPPLPYKNNPIYHQQPKAAPIHLSGSVLLRPGSSGAPPVASFRNPMGQDMEILEIKFEVSGYRTQSVFNAYLSGFGGSITCELMLGGIKVTNGSIPVWNFGKVENIAGEIKVDDRSSTLGNTLSFCSYSWRLPRPLFIPAGGVLEPKFFHTGLSPIDLTVRVGYSARTVFKQPQVVNVPWVAKYSSIAMDVAAAAQDQSSQLDLVNDNPEPFNLQRMVGRVLSITPNTSTGGQPTESEILPYGISSKYLTLRIMDSYGRPIVRTYTPFRSVFGALTRSWEMDNGAVMDPGSYYIVSLRKIVAPYEANTTIQSFVSIVGWREVQP